MGPKVPFLGGEDPLENGMAVIQYYYLEFHVEEPDGLQDHKGPDMTGQLTLFTLRGMYPVV